MMGLIKVISVAAGTAILWVALVFIIMCLLSESKEDN